MMVRLTAVAGFVLVATLLLAAAPTSADVVELRNGQRIVGTLKHADATRVVIDVIGMDLTFPVEKVRAIYYGASPEPPSAPGTTAPGQREDAIAEPPRTTLAPPSPRSFPSVGAPAPSSPPGIGSKPVAAIRLGETAPAGVISDRGSAIRLAHTLERGGGRFSSAGRVTATHQGMTFAFGLMPLELKNVVAMAGVDAGAVLGLELEIRNPTQSTAHIDWASVTLIGPTGTVERVIHRGIRFAERAGAPAPTTLPPGTQLEDFIYPSRLVRFSSSRYGSSWYGEAYFEAMRPGQQFRLYLPIRHGGELIEYQFTFVLGPPVP